MRSPILRKFAVTLIAAGLCLSGLHSEEIVFAAYNVKSYLEMSRTVDGERVADAPKPTEEIEAVVRVIKTIRPDILGLVEMGSKADLKDIQSRLKAAGLDYPHSEWMQGGDETRHVCLLSRFPIVERQSLSDIPVPINGRVARVSRGFLDVTVEVNPNYHLRCIGVHLKSRRPVPEYDQAVMRAKEAWFLRDHVVTIIENAPETNLLIFGDFNDEKNQYPIRTIVGHRGSRTHMSPLPLADSRGEYWTHFWPTADSYSRIDYIMVNKALENEIVPKETGVNDSPFWDIASDHRAIYTTISAEDKP